MTREPEASSTAVAPMPTCTHRWGTDTLESRVNFAGRTPQPRALSEVTLFTGFGKHDAITTDPCVREAVAGRISVGPTAGKKPQHWPRHQRMVLGEGGEGEGEYPQDAAR